MTTTSALLPATTEVGTITLLARDLPRLADFYTTLLGLTPTAQTVDQVTLAAHGTPLLILASRWPIWRSPTFRPLRAHLRAPGSGARTC